MTKIIAIHLPQFHEIAENNEWWGKGFTEWTNMSADNKYSDGLRPLNDNYYNLLDRETMVWQYELSSSHGIYGFCYYHYWFGNGKMLLEKPVENLLKWTDIPQRFCFEWANHSWARTWNGSREMLMEQTYGDEIEWARHYDYLRQFFLDERYIKIDNKPVFSLFNNEVDEKDDIIQYFNKRCIEDGFNGIYFIEEVKNDTALQRVSPYANAINLRSPSYDHSYLCSRLSFYNRAINSIKYRLGKKFKFKCLVVKYKGNVVKKSAIECYSKFSYDKKAYFGASSMWDNTYRHKWRGYKITKPSAEVFEWYLTEIVRLSREAGNDYIFFNAWNEWAEGMMLEPDTKNEYFYLDIIKKVMENGNE